MTTDSMWLIERVPTHGRVVNLHVLLDAEPLALEEISRLTNLWPGEYRAVEYRRVKDNQ